MTQENHGIIVSGGAFHADQVAVGRNAQAVKNIYGIAHELQASGKEEIATQLTELIELLKARQGDIQESEEVIQAVQQVAEELQKEKPNRLTLKSLLNGIKEGVGAVTEVVEKIGALQTAIALVTGLALL